MCTAEHARARFRLRLRLAAAEADREQERVRAQPVRHLRLWLVAGRPRHVSLLRRDRHAVGHRRASDRAELRALDGARRGRRSRERAVGGRLGGAERRGRMREEIGWRERAVSVDYRLRL